MPTTGPSRNHARRPRCGSTGAIRRQDRSDAARHPCPACGLFRITDGTATLLPAPPPSGTTGRFIIGADRERGLVP